MEKGAREKFLSGAMAAMGESTALIEDVAEVLGDTIEELDERNQGLAEKLRKANEEAAGLRELRRSAEELRDAYRRAMDMVTGPALLPEIHGVFAALAEAPSIEDQHLQRDLVWALERLAENSTEHTARIRIIADRFHLPVKLPILDREEPGEEEPDSPGDDEEISVVGIAVEEAEADELIELLCKLGLKGAVVEFELDLGDDEEEPELSEANRAEFERMGGDPAAEMKRAAVNELASRMDRLFRSNGAEPGKPL